jgi:hypothetical protein
MLIEFEPTGGGLATSPPSVSTIKEFMVKHCMTRKDMADTVGVTPRTVYRWLSPKDSREMPVSAWLVLLAKSGYIKYSC